MRKSKVFANEPLRDDEKETHINMLAADRSTWIVYTDDERMIKLFDSIGENKREKGFGFEYDLDASKITFAKPVKKAKLEKPAKQAKVKKIRPQKATFGTFFVKPELWNASSDERKTVACIDFSDDPMDFTSIKNLKQLRAVIMQSGNKKNDQQIHRLTLEVYRRFLEFQKKEKKDDSVQ